jgi:hypothetical protein
VALSGRAQAMQSRTQNGLNRSHEKITQLFSHIARAMRMMRVRLHQVVVSVVSA